VAHVHVLKSTSMVRHSDAKLDRLSAGSRLDEVNDALFVVVLGLMTT
jgi:hypothetical protein